VTRFVIEADRDAGCDENDHGSINKSDRPFGEAADSTALPM
jgi:hypothetical protein